MLIKIISKERISEKLKNDKETEFTNKEIETFLKVNHVHWFTTENVEIKCASVERFNRTINKKNKQNMYAHYTKNIDIRSKLLYNNSNHRASKMTPLKASKKNKLT